MVSNETRTRKGNEMTVKQAMRIAKEIKRLEKAAQTQEPLVAEWTLEKAAEWRRVLDEGANT
jgi:hypothetical protein